MAQRIVWDKDKNRYVTEHYGPATPKYVPRAATAPMQSQLVCPHCQHRGAVHTKTVKVKRGISGGKATGAVLTGGFSLLATGLSRKQTITESHCDNCGSTWQF